MTKIAPTTTLRAVATTPAPALTLDDLARMSSADLAALYSSGNIPSSFADFGRRPRGRVLAVRHLDHKAAAAVVRTIAALGVFPWRGKSMATTGRYAGDGINRVKLGVNTNWFEFTMQVEKSVIDSKDSVVFDYADKGNPWPIRLIRDELREIEPGLFVGPAMIKTPRGRLVSVLWFALDGR